MNLWRFRSIIRKSVASGAKVLADVIAIQRTFNKISMCMRKSTVGWCYDSRRLGMVTSVSVEHWIISSLIWQSTTGNWQFKILCPIFLSLFCDCRAHKNLTFLTVYARAECNSANFESLQATRTYLWLKQTICKTTTKKIGADIHADSYCCCNHIERKFTKFAMRNTR